MNEQTNKQTNVTLAVLSGTCKMTATEKSRNTVADWMTTRGMKIFWMNRQQWWRCRTTERKQGGNVWTGFIWLRRGASGGLHKGHGISWL